MEASNNVPAVPSPQSRRAKIIKLAIMSMAVFIFTLTCLNTSLTLDENFQVKKRIFNRVINQ